MNSLTFSRGVEFTNWSVSLSKKFLRAVLKLGMNRLQSVTVL